jgi:RNA polymerase sigma-70 factor (ECF subfamily)
VTTSIEDQLAAARAVWPDLEVDGTRFAAELARRLGCELTPELLGKIRADDVYLAIACADGAPAAIAHLEREYMQEVEIAASKLRATKDQTDEMRGHLRQILFTAEPGRAAALASFSGRGDLRGYLRVIVTRELIRMINKGRREVPLGDDEILDRLGIPNDPEISIMRRRYGADVDAALRAALAGLDDRGRALLRYSLIDGWSIDRIAEVYGVHRATAARWLTGVRERIGDRIRSELATRLSLPVDEVSSIVRLLHSRIEVSFERIIADPT